MTWQYGQLGLTESGGNRLIKYADAIINGASPNDGKRFLILAALLLITLYSGNTYFKNQTEIWNLFQKTAKIQDARSG